MSAQGYYGQPQYPQPAYPPQGYAAPPPPQGYPAQQPYPPMQYQQAPPPPQESGSKDRGCLATWFVPSFSLTPLRSDRLIRSLISTSISLLQYRHHVLLLPLRGDLRMLLRMPRMLLLDENHEQKKTRRLVIMYGAVA
ncbi:hypothetical protein VTN00DRAFT_5231 [Thermoascus crustaceus]|uniref:uncharacterized protein n=1 Tax=Thermoascus crustaceus TaxID=5088 RepID=UPI003741E9AE